MTGPILEGMDKPVQLVARRDGVRHIVNMAAICAADSIRQDSYWESLVSPISDGESSPSSYENVGRRGLHMAPVTNPAHNPPNKRFAHPSTA